MSAAIEAWSPSPAAVARGSSRRPTSTTLAPALIMALAMPRPRPEPPPVIRAVSPARLNGELSFGWFTDRPPPRWGRGYPGRDGPERSSKLLLRLWRWTHWPAVIAWLAVPMVSPVLGHRLAGRNVGEGDLVAGTDIFNGGDRGQIALAEEPDGTGGDVAEGGRDVVAGMDDEGVHAEGIVGRQVLTMKYTETTEARLTGRESVWVGFIIHRIS